MLKRIKSKNKSKRPKTKRSKSRRPKSKFQMKRKKQDDDISSLLQNMNLNDSENSHQAHDLLERANILKHEKLQIQKPSSNQRTFARRPSDKQKSLIQNSYVPRGISTYQELEEKRLEEQLEDQIDYLTNKLNSIKLKKYFFQGKKRNNIIKQTEEEKQAEIEQAWKDWEKHKKEEEDEMWEDALRYF